MRAIGGWAVAGVLLAMACGPAMAFGTIRGLGQNAEHEVITRQGLARFGFGPRTLDEIAGKRGSFGAVGAPDRPDRGLMSASEAHCDNGDWLDLPGYPHPEAEARAVLESCRSYILLSMEMAVTAAGDLVDADLKVAADQARLSPGCRYNGRAGRAKCNVLEQLGLAFHAAQDFYSHSNWVDPLRRPGLRVDDPPGLGQASPADWLAADSGVVRFPEGLITGCYEGFPETRHCDGRVKHATLNKDGARSPRGQGGVQRLAMDVAASDTEARWTWFYWRLVAQYGEPRAELIACVIRTDDPAACRP